MADKLVTTSYLNTILNKLYDWMPFKRSNGGIHQNSLDSNGESTLQTINSGEIALGNYNVTDSNTIFSYGIGENDSNRKNAIKISKNGEIHIITNFVNGTAESLQSLLDNKGVEICNEYKDVLKFISDKHLGKLLFLQNDSVYNGVSHDAGLYIVSINSETSTVGLFKIADTLKKELSNYYTKVEVEKLIEDIAAGDFSGLYYTKTEIDNKVETITFRLRQVESFVSSPIQIEDLEIITRSDLNEDGIIG